MLYILTNLPRRQKQLVLLVFDTAVLYFILWASFFIRLGSIYPSNLSENLVPLLLTPIFSVLSFYFFGLYHKVIRFLTPNFLLTTAKAMAVACAAFLAFAVLLRAEGIPRSIYFMYWAFGLASIGGIRLFAREILPIPNQTISSRKIRVAIYGAGAAGTQLAQALRASREYLPVFFIDDKKDLWNWEVFGIKVFDPNKLKHLVKAFDIEEIILSMPTIPRSERKKILDSLANLPLKVKTLPSIVNLVDGKVRVEDITRVEIEDLLGRKPVDPVPELIQANIKDKNVMVTGAGGSIGSEMCRQIVRQKPSRLVLFEMNEYALFKIHTQLKTTCLETNIQLVPVLGTVLDKDHVERLLKTEGIHTLYHTAAYKHVPLVEANIIEGVKNNVLGTLSVAGACQSVAIERMILISTDKAVRPTSIMGASKRLAELILQAMAGTQDETIFTMVRFGNVLGSSGSVVPIFRKQIKNGGPVTITDPEMTRYFMTIPEAAQLVIQAGAMAHGGEVFLLDMGEPVKIKDVAIKMIHLSGFSVKTELNLDGDIEIRTIGLRPGEKLYEELLIGGDSEPSTHPRIRVAKEQFLQANELETEMKTLKEILGKCDQEAARTFFKQIISDNQLQ